MNQTELNLYWVQAILYYCFQINPVFFDTWGTQCGNWGYDENDNLYIVNWLLNNQTYDISEPSVNTLLTYDSQVVINFHNSYYLWVNDINQSQPYLKFSSSQIASIPVALCTKGYKIYDTTKLWLVVFDGTQWIDT
jgi:hypothetical protein